MTSMTSVTSPAATTEYELEAAALPRPPADRQVQGDGGAGAAGAGVLTLARLKQLTSVVAPTTLITSLLFYFGYVSTRSRFDYFGIYLDMTDLSNQRLLLYGLEVIYIPAALGLLAVLVAITFHTSVMWLLEVRRSDTAILIIGPGAVLAGVLLMGRGLVGIFVARVYDNEMSGMSGLAIALGPAAVAYGICICARRARRAAPARAERTGLIAWYDGPAMAGLRRAGQVCAAGLAIAGLFWAVHDFAWTFGPARAYQDARKLPKQAEVVLDTREQLTELPAGVTVSMLPAAARTTFRYRYRGLRLLLSSGGRLFLVPEHWTKRGRTLVVPYDSGVRIQLIPQPGGFRG